MPKANGSKRVASKADLLTKLDRVKNDLLQREEVYLAPPIDETVLVWELWGDERETYLATLQGKQKQRIPVRGGRGRNQEIEIESQNNPGQLRLCALALKDDHGNVQWTEDELRRKLPATAIDKIHDVAWRLSFPNAEGQAEVGKGSLLTDGDEPSSKSHLLLDVVPSESFSKG